MIKLEAGDAGYPRGLRDLGRPPAVWIAGDVEVLDRRCVAVVGTRRMTGYGERVAREVASALARAGAVVVSGLAQGIDSAAHAAALDAGAPSIAVLGQGIASFRREIGGRRRRLAERCVLLSPYEPAAPALPWMFARRNELVAALAEAVVVVEAPMSSGALITARIARRLGRPLYAIPGPLGSSASLGTNRLLVDGLATMVMSVDALCESMGLRTTNGAARPALADALAAGPLSPDMLARALGTDAAEVASLAARDPHVILLADGRLAWDERG